jgi:hypothetical protein
VIPADTLAEALIGLLRLLYAGQSISNRRPQVSVFRHDVRFDIHRSGLEAGGLSTTHLNSSTCRYFIARGSQGPRIALKGGRGSSRKQSSGKDQMVDIILLLMAIASAISLLVVSPREVQRRAILALKECEEMELSRAHGRGEDGQARAIPMNLGRSAPVYSSGDAMKS